MKTSFLHITRILLLTVGLSPYHQSIFSKFQVILFFSTILSFVTLQFAVFLTSECTPDLIIKVFSIVLCNIFCIILYNSFWINKKNVKYLLDQIQHVYDQLKDQTEILILEKYTYFVNRLAITFIVSFMVWEIAIFLQPLLQHIFGIFDEKFLLFQIRQIKMEYFVDQDKHFYLTFLYMNVILYISTLIVMSTGALFAINFAFYCGMFTIAGYRFEHAMTVNLSKNIHPKDKMVIQRNIIHAIDIQRKAMELNAFLMSNFEKLFFTMVLLGVAILSMNFYQVILLRGDIGDLSIHLLCIIFIFLYMFLSCFCGQEFIDCNDNIYMAIYNIEWYRAPLRIQKLVLFLLQRNNKILSLTVGGLFTASFEFFRTLTSASASYLTVMCSTQQ